MTDIVKKRLIKYSAVCGSITLMLLMFYGLSYFGTIVRRKYTLRTATAVCAAASALQNHAVKITGIYAGKSQGLLFRYSLTAVYDEKPARLFLLPLAGRYGVYTGVFLYEASVGCIFCGLTGTGAYSDAVYCGISPAALAVQRKKVENFMAGAVP
ncbi:MAG: hypothetical protein ACTTH7_08105 [Treponema sp.]